MDIAALRQDYRLAALDESSAGNDPLALFSRWLDEAAAARIAEINAMTLATADAQGRPHARIVLLKGLDTGFVFFSNYESAKGTELTAQPQAALLFFWKELERQVRVEGAVERVSETESDEYFASRPEGSRIGAWASPQSRIIHSRAVLEQAEAELKKEFAGNIPRPPHWGGYRLTPQKIEFWQGRSSRLHDRLVYTADAERWERHRLAP